jgi:membrane protein DedA with SNARE-associated domain
MIWLYFWFCGLFYLGASLDEVPEGPFKRAFFYLSCFIEGAIGMPMVIGAAVWLYIEKNKKKEQ